MNLSFRKKIKSRGIYFVWFIINDMLSRTTLNKYIFISRANESEKNIADAKSLTNIYESFDFAGCNIGFHLYPDENHASTLIVATSNALADLKPIDH